MVGVGIQDPVVERAVIMVRNPGRVWVVEERFSGIMGILLVTCILRYPVLEDY